MTDEKIVQLYFERNETAIEKTANITFAVRSQQRAVP